jgi:putative NIF3 family GTP cyclohydrolase 1 type 2
MARALGLKIEGPFGEHQGVNVGWWGRKEGGVASVALASELELVLKGPVRVIEGGPEVIERIGVVTGAGGSFIEESVGLGLDALITGEVSHAEYFDAVELGISVLLGGHYATETLGVKAVGAHLEERFGLTWEFLEQPTGF